MILKRSSGILLHITSLPSPFGIGDLGHEAYEMIDFLETSGHRYWQLLPLNPTLGAYNHSPYSSDSAFAGNVLLISPELLEKEGYIDLQNYSIPVEKDLEKVDFEKVYQFKSEVLEAAYAAFKSKKSKPKEFMSFCAQHRSWLDDYSLYKSLHFKFDAPWNEWPVELRDRKPVAIKKAVKENKEFIEKIKFHQYLFFGQWQNFTNYAHLNQVHLIGDIPFYINHDSADCWANASYFKLDSKRQPVKVSGVPPDYFSDTGQLWGSPVYDWKVLKANKFDWWVERIRQNLLLFDLVRLDHFRAFAAYWEVPAGDKTAANGKWAKTPGKDFFRIIEKEFPEMPLIAEDLGFLDKPVYQLLEKFNFPGMKVLQFAFGEEKVTNPYLPFNYLPHTVVYTGTHDNNTTKGWFAGADKSTKQHLKDYTGKNISPQNVHKVLHILALQSVAKIAIIPMQDIIGLGAEALMNIPGSMKGNWTWRMKYDQIPTKKAMELKGLNALYGRSNEVEDDVLEHQDLKGKTN